MLKKTTLYLALISLLLCLFIALPVGAADSVSGGVKEFGDKVYSAPGIHPAIIIGIIIKGLLGLVGLLFFILVLYGGFLYMTSGGADEKIKKGKNYIVYAAIGLAIVLSAYAIASFVTKIITNAQTGFN